MIMIIHGYSQISETLRFNTEYVGCSAKIAAESFALAGERTEAHLEKRVSWNRSEGENFQVWLSLRWEM